MTVNDFKLITSPHPLLLQCLKPYEFNIDVDPLEIEKSMINIMDAHNGIGISANQVNYNRRVIAMRLQTSETFAMFNPTILNIDAEEIPNTEGCLSFPNLVLNIKRPKSVEVCYLTSNNESCTIKLLEYDAKCFLHELDHINGICFVSRVSKLKLDLAIRKMRKNNGRTK